jgi:hypothetical protein
MKIKSIVMSVVVAMSLAACGSVETGQVGVRTTFSGEVEQQELQQGFYTSVTSDVRKYTVKQIPVTLADLKPKAADNLRLQDFDVTIYYAVNPASVADLVVKYNNSTAYDTETSIGYPAYNLVEQVARSAANEAVAKVPSMQLNDKRTEMEAFIKESLQKEFDKSDKGTIIIERVNITNILTDATVEDSIRAVAASENRKKQAQNELEVAKVEAETLRVRSQSLDSKLLADKQLDVMKELAKSQNKVFVVPSDFKGNMIMQ